VAGHFYSLVSLLVIVANLTFWCLWLFLLAVLRFVFPPSRARTDVAMAWIYRAAVVIDDWWLNRVMGIRWNRPLDNLDPQGCYLVLSNHRSWSDIFLVQSVIVRDGPILKFLIKQELVWLPIVGLILWAYEFPVLRRATAAGQSDQQRRERDRAAVTHACTVLRSAPAALMNFAEGTRLTEAKRVQRGGRFRHLLPPRSGGFTTSCAALSDRLTGIIDLTLVYPQPITFWEFLSGKSKRISVDAEMFTPEQLPVTAEGLRDWLTERWEVKDRLLQTHPPQPD
jgi:1-acyl-sn-glycerol-3-phosphate acyltransferase